MSLWDNRTVAEATGGAAQGTWQASRVVIDSRSVKPGDLFVAVKGERFDGHAFVQEALAKGAVAAVVSNSSPFSGAETYTFQRKGADPQGQSEMRPFPKSSPIGEGTLLAVPDTLRALDNLGTYNRNRSHAKVIGVTGSVGKTSVKEMLRLALGVHGRTYATSGNYNNHIGTPLNLANLPQDAAFAVFEMGMNHEGEIAHLTRMVKPDVAVITNVEAAHLEFFESVERIADAKAEIFGGVEKDGVAVLNADNAYGDYLRTKAVARGLRPVMCGEAAQADCRLLGYHATAEGSFIKALLFGAELTYGLNAIGRHWALASLQVLAVAHALGLDSATAMQGISAFEEPEGRGQTVRVTMPQGEILLIDDSYNASPASMRSAIAKTDEVWQANGRKGRKIAALGDMLELGPNGPQLHAELAAQLEQHGFSEVFTAGALMRNLQEALPPHHRGQHVQQAIDLLEPLQTCREHDVLLVKGSHGSNMYKLATALQVNGEKKIVV